MQSHPIPLRLTLVMLIFLLAAIGAHAQGGFVRARVRSFKGVARIYAGPGVFPPKINQLLEPGNKIETGPNSRVVISLNDGSQITVLPNSNVVLENFGDAQTVRELLDILVGRVIVKIHHIGGGLQYRQSKGRGATGASSVHSSRCACMSAWSLVS